MDDKDMLSKMNALKPENIIKRNALKPENIIKKITERQKEHTPLLTMNPIPSYSDFNARDYINIDTSELDASFKEKEEFRKSVVSALQGIEKNTALLTEMTFLLQRSNDKQDQTFALMVEILEIMKSKDQEEAESKFTVVMKKITDFTDNASTLQSLWGMANTVFKAYQALPL